MTITTATLATAIPAAHMASLGRRVYSSAMASWALVCNNDNEPQLLVLFSAGGTVYRYAFSSWEAARDWDSLRDEDDCEDAEPISWGSCFHRFMKEGDILPIAA